MKAVDSKVDHLASLVEKKKSDDVFGQEVRFAEPCACAAARVAPGGQATVVCELFCRRPVEACPPCGLLTRARCDRCCAVWSVPASNASECLAVNASPNDYWPTQGKVAGPHAGSGTFYSSLQIWGEASGARVGVGLVASVFRCRCKRFWTYTAGHLRGWM